MIRYLRSNFYSAAGRPFCGVLQTILPLRLMSCRNGMMSFVYKMDGTIHSNAINIYNIITSNLLIISHIYSSYSTITQENAASQDS